MPLFDFFRKRNLEEFRPREFPLLRAKERESKRVKETKGGEKWVFGFLAGTILLSVGFWLWGLVSRSELKLPQKSSQVSVVTPIPTSTPPPRKTEGIISEISRQTKDLKGTYGVYVYNLTAKYFYSLKENEIFTAASLIKLPVILTLYQEAETGRFNLETKYVLKQADKLPGAGSLQSKPAGTVYTYRQLAELMGQQSDNTAFNVMRKTLGDQKIQETINKLGMNQTSLLKNETTPADIGLFFRKLYGGSVVSREHRDEILGFLTKTIYEDRIPAGVPAETRVAHKIGTETGIFSDAGIVFADRPFILVIMSKNALEKEAKEALPAITKAVWEFETGE